jgi:hypothetical protein
MPFMILKYMIDKSKNKEIIGKFIKFEIIKNTTQTSKSIK